MTQDRTRTTRRKVISHLAGAATVAVAAPFVITPRRAFAGGRMVMVSYGGTYRTAIETALVKPFSQEFGVEVTMVDTPDIAKVKAQQMTGNIEWDVFEAPGPMAAAGSKLGYWEPLDLPNVDPKDLFIPMKKDLAPLYLYTGGIAWDPKKHADGKVPRTFPEYWDAKKFPGPRTLRNRPSETLEVALLADGVHPKDLYPLDLDRAFKSLDRIKPHIGKWIEETPQSISLLERGEVEYSYTYASRVKNTNGKLAFSLDQTVHGLEYLAVMKGAPNKANAMRFAQFAMRPDRQAAWMNIQYNLPAGRKALALMSPEAKKFAPNMDSPNIAIVNDDYWADKLDSVTRRFKEWVLA